uniref:Uncharacterized protein n=1 Tax=Arundo donax TaxID=35708 RepID=A0A0A8Y090_ARUDO
MLLQEQHRLPPVVLHARAAPAEATEPLLVHPARTSRPPRRARGESSRWETERRGERGGGGGGGGFGLGARPLPSF